MALIRKTSPVGIDIPIDRLQDLLYNGFGVNISALSWVTAENGYQSYHRAYRNEDNQDEAGQIVEAYDGTNEYIDVFYSDNFSASSFFLTDENIGTDGHLYNTDISIIFQLNLAETYPNITHRADEEAHREVLLMLENAPWPAYSITGLITGIDNVYAALNLDKIRYTDMHPRHAFMVNMNVEYEYNC